MKKFGLNYPNSDRYAVIKKGLFVMKITLLLILFSTLNLLATGTYSQTAKVSLKLNQTSVKLVLKEIEHSSEFYFLYNNELIDVERKVDIQADNEQINTILDRLFNDQEIKYAVYDRQIVISPVNMPLPQQAQRKVSGQVTDQSGVTLPGVSVVVKGTTTGTITDAKGNYSLTNIPENATLLFSFVGMKTQEVKIAGKTSVSVKLEEETIGLDEVVAVGYGTVKRQNLTGSVSSIKSEALEQRVVTTLGETFAGQLAGVRAQQVSGKPGAELDIVIRGNHSISGTNTPLYIIDGIPADDMKDLNPNDISSIEVLKDASSSAIYGARGAGGVVLITTKQGKKGKPTFNFDMYYGLQQREKMVDVMNRDEFITYNLWRKNEDYRRAGGDLSIPPSSRPVAYQYPASWAQPETLPDINWPNEIMRIAPVQSYQLTSSGGSDIGSFLISGSFMQQEGIVKETDYQRANFRVNTTLNVGKHLKLGMNIAPSFSDENNPMSEGQASSITYAVMFAPIVPLNMNTEEWGYTPAVLAYPNPLEVLKEVHNNTKNNKVLTNIWGDLTITKSLSFKSQYGYNFREERNAYCKPGNINDGDPTQGSSYVNDSYGWSLQNAFTYTPKISSLFDVTMLLGQSMEKSKYYNILAKAQDYPIDLIYTLNYATKPLTASTTESENSLASFFGRLNLNAKDKYLLTVSARRDGSSRFGRDTKWGWFPSASVGWKINRENFMKQIDWLSLLKLRASIGKAGNNNIGDYSSIAQLGQTNYNLNGTIVSGLSPATSGNPDLGWETLISRGVGIDMGAFNGRIQATLDYYINDTRDMLFNVPVPYLTGYSSMLENIGKVQNKGWEFELTSYNTKKVLNWTTSFNISRNVNEVKKLGVNDTPIINSESKFTCFITKVGEPIGSYYMYKTDGLLLDKDFDASGKPIVPIATGQEKGNVKIVDVNKDGKINANDFTIVGNNQPDFTWGMTNRFSFKGFDLNILVQGSQGGDVFFLGARQMDIGAATYNQYERWLRCYKSDLSTIPTNTTINMTWDGKTPNLYGNNPSYNDTWIYDASFVRIKNITLGYNLPKSLYSRFGIGNARVYIMGDNIYTWNHHYPGYSNETNSFARNNTTEPGVDYGTYPLTRKYSIGINITF